MAQDIDGPVIQGLLNKVEAAEAMDLLVTMNMVQSELNELLDGIIEAPNVWRWTVMRAVKRLEKHTGVPAADSFEANPFRNIGKPIGYLWTKPDGTELMLHPDEVRMVVGPKDSTEQGQQA